MHRQIARLFSGIEFDERSLLQPLPVLQLSAQARSVCCTSIGTFSTNPDCNGTDSHMCKLILLCIYVLTLLPEDVVPSRTCPNFLIVAVGLDLDLPYSSVL